MRYVPVPARLIEAGVVVLSGDARSVTYRCDNRAVTADLVVVDRVASSSGLLSRSRRTSGRRILVVCETVSEAARSALLADGEVDLSVGDTGELVLSGTTYRERIASPPRAGLRQHDWRRHAAERICVLTDDRLRQSDLAAAIGVSQQSVSKMISKRPLPTTPMNPERRRELLDDLTAVAAGDGFVATYWYGADSVSSQVRSAIRLGEQLTVQVLASGEVAADLLQPWRVPTHGLVYATELIDLTDAGLVPATAAEATLTVRVPADPTVWPTAAWWRRTVDVPRSDIPTADPVLVLQDLMSDNDVGDGAPQRLADWIASR